MQINENVTLAPFTVFKIGGPARYFCEVKNKDEVAEAIRWAGNKFAGRGAPFFILGAGSNVLISDEGFPGLVIKMNLQEIKMAPPPRSEEHTSELQSHVNIVCRLLLEKKKKNQATLGISSVHASHQDEPPSLPSH